MQRPDVISLLQQHDPQGLQEFHIQYSPLMRYIIAPILPDHREQEECLSDISMLVWEKIDLYDAKKGNFKTWLTVLTRNTALNRARKNRKIPPHEELTPDIASTADSPEEYVIKKEQAAALRTALHTLSNFEQILFYRKYYYLQPTAQIAAELGMSERAVEGRLYRLKKRFQTRLRRDGYEW